MENIKSLPPLDEMKQAFYHRDASYDGIFFVAVHTTGIFCRPTCPARKPKEENITFYATARDAIFSGYRPCKRCLPLAANGTPPDWIQTLIDRVEDEPARRIPDYELREMDIDPARARRYFFKHYGVTFQAYSRARRMGKALTQIRKGDSLDEVALGNGFESHSGFRDAFGRIFNTPPGKAENMDCIFTELIESPIGPLIAGATSEGVCLLEFSERRRLEKQFNVLRRRFALPILPGGNNHLEHLKQELTAYFNGALQNFTVPLLYPGSDFQVRVWDQLRRIPYGETRCYEDLAREIDSPKASRAVGTANGWNRIAILVPCHRVITKDGKLGGYGGGKWRKQWLLDLEDEHSSEC